MEIRTNVKRGKGKLTGCLTIKDAYLSYKQSNIDKSRDYVDKGTFSKLCKEFNKELIDQVIEESESVKLPHRLGKLFVIKRNLDLGSIPKNKWKVNYQKSKELGYIVYFDNDKKYYIRWDKKVAIFKWKSVYLFNACRTAKRQLGAAIKNKKDYYLK